MSELLIRIFYWLLDFYLLAAILLVAGFVVNLRLRQPSRRLVVTRALFLNLVFLAVAVAMPFWPRMNLALVVIGEDTAAMLQQLESTVDRIDNPSTKLGHLKRAESSSGELSSNRAFIGTSSSVTSPSREWNRKIPTIIAIGSTLIFLVGAMVVCGWQFVGRIRAWCFVWNSHPSKLLDAELSCLAKGRLRRTAIRISDEIAQPAALGSLFPIILVPKACVVCCSVSELRALIAHELAHIRRGDLWMLPVNRWLQVLLYWNPLFWWMKRKSNQDQELLADLEASRQWDAISYAEMLLNFSRMSHRQVMAGFTATLVGTSQLKHRIAHLVNPNISMNAVSTIVWKAGVGIALFSVAIVLSVFSIQGNSQLLNSAHVHFQSQDLQRSMETHRDFTIQLENGIKMELVAVRQHPCEGDLWWNPDGTLPFDLAHEIPPNPTAAEMIVRVTSPNDESLADLASKNQWSRLTDDASHCQYGQPDCQLFSAPIDFVGDRTDLKLLCNVGDWTTRSRSGRQLSTIDGEFTYCLDSDSEDSVVVSMTHPNYIEDFRLIAVDQCGIEHLPNDVTQAQGQLTATFRQVRFDLLQQLCVQTRSKRWVEFRNISLRPGDRTDVQVVTEG